jgi:hypothetical protein
VRLTRPWRGFIPHQERDLGVSELSASSKPALGFVVDPSSSYFTSHFLFFFFIPFIIARFIIRCHSKLTGRGNLQDKNFASKPPSLSPIPHTRPP